MALGLDKQSYQWPDTQGFTSGALIRDVVVDQSVIRLSLGLLEGEGESLRWVSSDLAAIR